MLPPVVSLPVEIPCLFAEGKRIGESPQLPADGSVHYCGKITTRTVTPRTFRPGIQGPLGRGLLLPGILLKNAQRCPATTGGEVGSQKPRIGGILM